MYASRFYDYHDSDVFSRVHMTLQSAFSVRPSPHPSVHHPVDPSIGSAFKLYRFFLGVLSGFRVFSPPPGLLFPSPLI